jgi:methyl-accepting chemotaxis protein
VKLVSATGEALARIGAKVADMNGVVADILAATRQQAASLQEIKSAVSQLSDGTQRNAAMAEESTAASQALARETAGLADMVGRFDVGLKDAPRRGREPPSRALRAAGGGAPGWREY